MEPDETGCIDFNEFVKAANDDSYLFDHKRFFTNVFRYLDTDKDGMIDFQEYQQIVTINPGNAMSQEEIKYSFNYIDSNKDAKISLQGKHFWEACVLGALNTKKSLMVLKQKKINYFLKIGF